MKNIVCWKLVILSERQRAEGSQLKTTAEMQLRFLDALRLLGMTYVFDVNKPAGKGIILGSVAVICNRPIF